MRTIKRKNKKTTVNLVDVAKSAGVSHAAACAALRGGRSGSTVVSEDTIKRVCALAKKMGYIPNSFARSLRSKKVIQIGVILPNRAYAQELQGPQSFETIMGINNELQKRGYVLVLAHLDDALNANREDFSGGSSVLFHEHLINVAIAVGQFSPENEKWLSERLSRIIWCDSRVWKNKCCVRRDEYDAGYKSVLQAAKAGYRSVNLIAYDYTFVHNQSHFSFHLRYKGICKACKELGLELRKFTQKQIQEFTPEKLCGHVFLTLAFDIAQNTYLDFCKKGCVPGKDLALLSCDEYRQQWWCFGDVARVSFNRASLGSAAARMAMDYSESGIEPPSELIQSDWLNIENSTLSPFRRNVR